MSTPMTLDEFLEQMHRSEGTALRPRPASPCSINCHVLCCSPECECDCHEEDGS